MLEKYRTQIAALDLRDSITLRLKLQLPSGSLFDAMQQRGLGQADAVLALLHAGRHAAVELLIGRPITVFPPQRSLDRRMSPLDVTSVPRRRLIVRARECPLKIPSAQARWRILSRCSHLELYMTRVPRWRALRDVREWSRAGWLEVA